MRLMLAVCALCLQVSLCPDVFASGAEAFQDIYIIRSGMGVIYKGAAPDAQEAQIADRADPAAPDADVSAQNGFVRIEADAMTYDHTRNVYHARGGVSIFYSGAALFADEVELDNQSNVATARGEALLKMGEDTLRGEKIVFNVEDKTGAAFKANAFYARNNFHVRGEKIAKTGEDTYFIERPCATTCDGEAPDWRIAGSEMKVTVEGYGHMKNARFLVKDLPVLYVPYLLFPAKTKRQTGLLMPYLAYSRDKDGADVEIPFFWAISRQMDATFYQRYIEKRGYKQGAEFRYYWDDRSFGTFYGDYMEDTKTVSESVFPATSRDWQTMHRRWSYYLNHQTYFNEGFYVRADLKKVSDKWYFKDFSSQNYYLDNLSKKAHDDFKNVSFQGDKSLRYLESTARVHKGWSHYTITGVINTTDDFAAFNNDQTLQRYPEILFAASRQQIMNSPVYIEFAGVYDYLYRGEGEKGHFVDLSPVVSMPFDILNYVRVTPQLAFKETFWSRDDDETDAKKKTADRAVYNASVSVGSRLSRVYDTNLKAWEKIRHEIKPEIIYSYIPDVPSDDVPDFYLPAALPFVTPLSTLSGNALTKQNVVAWSLTNTLTSRITEEAGGQRYLQFLRLKLYQTYDIHEANKSMTGSVTGRRPFSNMGIELDVTPHRYFSFRSRNIYNVYDGWKQNNLDLYFTDSRGDALSVGYRNTEDSIEEIHFNLRAVIAGGVEGTVRSRYDLLNSRKIENALGVVYRKQCWSMGLSINETEDDVRFLFHVTLTGLGTLGIK